MTPQSDSHPIAFSLTSPRQTCSQSGILPHASIDRIVEQYLRRLAASLPRAVSVEQPLSSAHDVDGRLAELVDIAATFGSLLAGLSNHEARALCLAVGGRAYLRIEEFGALAQERAVARRLTREDCARAMGVSISAYKGLLERARARVRRNWERRS